MSSTTLDTEIAAGVTYEVAVCVTKRPDPTVAAVPDPGRTDVAVVLSLTDGGPPIPGLPASWPATDSGGTMTDPTDSTVTGQKYLATIRGTDTASGLGALEGRTVYRYGTVAGEPLGRVPLKVTASGR